MDSIKVQFPPAYNWLVQNKIVGVTPFSQIQPWYFLPKREMFWANEKWDISSPQQLLVFARRQDNDTLACFGVENNNIISIYVIHGWTNNGFDVLTTYDHMWEWFHSVLEDIKEWMDITRDEG